MKHSTFRMKHSTWRADPLVWGHGPRVFEVFLEPTCPYSVRAFGKLDDLLAQSGEDRVTIKIRLQSQRVLFRKVVSNPEFWAGEDGDLLALEAEAKVIDL